MERDLNHFNKFKIISVNKLNAHEHFKRQKNFQEQLLPKVVFNPNDFRFVHIKMCHAYVYK